MQFSSLLLLFSFFSITLSIDTIDDLIKREEIASLKYYGFRLTRQNQNPRPRKLTNVNSNFESSDWLKSVNDSRKIFSISLPGTHESCTRIGGPAIQCQDWSIEEQLLNGVRYLDIRVRHLDNIFMIHSGMVYQELSFYTGVMKVCINFLKAHPSEFIFIQVLEEYAGEGNTRTFEETMKSYTVGFERYFYLNEDSPTLKQVRGKIVLLRRFTSTISPLGNFLDFKDNTIFTSNTSIVARIQDCYVVQTLFVRWAKWNHFLSVIEEALVNTDENILFLNFANGKSSGCYPWTVVDYMNPRIGDYLENTEPSRFVGVVVYDYINSGYTNMIEILVRRNYQ